MKMKINAWPDSWGHGGWDHFCKGGETCSICGKKAEPGEKRIWECSMDQDDLFCSACAEITPPEVGV